MNKSVLTQSPCGAVCIGTISSSGTIITIQPLYGTLDDPDNPKTDFIVKKKIKMRIWGVWCLSLKDQI